MLMQTTSRLKTREMLGRTSSGLVIRALFFPTTFHQPNANKEMQVSKLLVLHMRERARTLLPSKWRRRRLEEFASRGDLLSLHARKEQANQV